MEKTNSPVYWSLLTHEDWIIHIAATSEGLCYVGSQNKPFEELSAWSNARLPGSRFILDSRLQAQSATRSTECQYRITI